MARIRWTGTPAGSFLSDLETSRAMPRFRIYEMDDGRWDLHDRLLWQRSDHETLTQARGEAERIVAEEA